MMNSMTTSSATPTFAEAPLPSSCSFIEGKYILSLRGIIRDIKKYIPAYAEMFIDDAGMCTTTLVPHKNDIHTGFEVIEETIKDYPYVKIGDALQVPYGRAWVGYKFSTEHFNNLQRLPGKCNPTFSIYLPTKYKKMLDAISDSHPIKLETLWDKKNLRDEIKVDYIDDYGNLSTGSTLEFAYWFAHTLATQYLTWYKKNPTLSVSTTPVAADYDTESDCDLEASTEANAKVNKRDLPQEDKEEPIAKRLRSNTNANNNKRARNVF